MKLFCRIIFLIFYVTATKSSIYSSLKDNLLSYIESFNQQDGMQRSIHDESQDDEVKDDGAKKNQVENLPKNVPWQKDEQLDLDDTSTKGIGISDDGKEIKILFHDTKNAMANRVAHTYSASQWPKDLTDIETAKNKSKILRAAKHADMSRNQGNAISNSADAFDSTIDRHYFHMDPVMNGLRKSYVPRQGTSNESASSSSSREMPDWKEEFKEIWLHKKFEALNQSKPRGDEVNMIAARPWGVPCGDPNQHDMPWGSCMLPMECDAEYRIYRGDHFCGRTQFICCALQLTTYDMYQGFDVSFDDKSLSTDSDEKKDKAKTSKEKRKRKRARERRKRRKGRQARKRKMKKNIKRIIKEIRKILNKQYRNGTKQRKKRTKQLKKFIKDLKKQYRKDRQSVKDLHEKEMIRIDSALQIKLNQIKEMNHNFMNNMTFREILINGTITKAGARMLLEAYPELSAYLEARRIGGGTVDNEDHPEYLEYDIEYGFLYY